MSMGALLLPLAIATSSAFTGLYQSSYLRFSNSLFLKVSWTNSFGGGNGKIFLKETNAHIVRTIRIGVPKDCWPGFDIRIRPAGMLTRGQKPGQAVLDLTLNQESGVYGFHEVLSYIVRTKPTLSVSVLGQPTAFSSLGSWRRTSPDTLEMWDADLGEAVAHSSPHHYFFKKIREVKKMNKLVFWKFTKRVYKIYWEPFEPGDLDPYDMGKDIPRALDPLEEFGTRWTWWGKSR